MIRLINVCILLLAVNLISAQVPQYYKGLGTSNSTFLFGYPNESRHSQCIYLNSDLQSPPSGTIDYIFYRYGNTGQTTGNTLYNFRVNFLQTTDTAFANTNEFFTGTTNALSTDSLVIPPGITGNWFPIQLTTPFDYDSSLSLVVELRYDSVTEQVFGTYGTSNNGRKLISGDSTSVTGDVTSFTWQDFGFNLFPVGINEMNKNDFTFFAMPNPFLNSLFVTLSQNVSDATLDVIDIAGKHIYSKKNLSGKHFTFISEYNKF